MLPAHRLRGAGDSQEDHQCEGARLIKRLSLRYDCFAWDVSWAVVDEPCTDSPVASPTGSPGYVR